MELNTHLVEFAARMAHEANRAYCLQQGDDSQPKWEEAPDWQKRSAINGVMFHLVNPTADAGASHRNWLAEKEADGWVWAPFKDPVMKRHPCMLPFEALPFEQQIKDHIFRSVVHAVNAIWSEPGGLLDMVGEA